MKITLLGTGTSTGVPSIGCECETCASDDPRDKRLRVSVLIEHGGQTVLVDTSSHLRPRRHTASELSSRLARCLCERARVERHSPHLSICLRANIFRRRTAASH